MGRDELRTAVDLARRQFGVVAVSQLVKVGMSRDQILGLKNAGWLTPIHRGVYCVGLPIDRYESWLMAAVLAAGAGSALARDTAAAHWGFGQRTGPIEVVRRYNRYAISRDGERLLSGRKLIVHGSRSLPESDVTRHRGIPITSVARTFLDIASDKDIDDLRDLFEEAGRRNQIHVAQLEVALDRGSGRAGTAKLRELVDEWHPDDAKAKSKLENKFIRLCSQAGIRRPEQNVPVLGYEVDCLWRRERVVVELDSVSFHSQPSEMDKDRVRDIEMRQNEFEVLRFTNWRINNRPRWVMATLIEAIRKCGMT